MSISPCFETDIATGVTQAVQEAHLTEASSSWDTATEVVARVDDILAVVRHELEERELDDHLSAEGLATRITRSLIEHGSNRTTSRFMQHQVQGAEAVEAVLDYIDGNLACDLTLETIAAVAAFSPYHFARLFRRVTGTSPHQYIIGKRVERARVLLLTTDWTLTAIAREVGFAGGSHLALHFKRATGTCPRHFRIRQAVAGRAVD